MCANILNFGINLFSLYKRINNTLFDGKDVVPEVDISFEKFNSIVKSIEPKNSEIFKNLKEKYLYTHSNTSEKIINFIKTIN